MFKQKMKDQKTFEVIVQECPSEKKDVMDKLIQRSEARLVEMGKKKSAKEGVAAFHEQTDFFNVAFTQAKNQIQSKLTDISNIEKNMLVYYFDEIAKDCQKLQKFLSDSTLFLPTYDIKIAQEILNNIQDEIQRAQGIFLPKKKFAFKNRKKSLSYVKDCVDLGKEKQKLALISDKDVLLHNCGFKDISHQTLEKNREEIDGQDVGLYFLKDCKVYLYGAPNTIFVSGLTDCHIFIGPVSTSVFIANCVNCTFAIACQQLRVHSTKSCSFYLHITSRSIIEDCYSLQFAPYNWTYEGLDRDFQVANLDAEKNNWDSIDDFNWLVSGVPSPNWSLITEEK